MRFSSKSKYRCEKLSNLCDVRDGTHDSPKYVKNGYPFVTSKNLLDDGTIDFNNVSYICEEDYVAFSKRSKPDVGDILFGMIGTIGKPVIIRDERKFAIKNVALIKQKQKLLNEYLLYKLSSHSILNQFKKNTDGGTQQFISLSNIRGLKIHYPDVSEQSKVKDFLILLDERINAQNKIIEKTKSLIKPLFEYLNKDAKKKIQITDVGKYYSADSVTWEEITDSGNPVVIYGQLFTEYKYVINNIVSKSKKKLLSQTSSNDLLFPSSTTVDAISLISPASIKQSGVMIGGDMFGIRINDDYDSDYLSFLINCSYKRELSKYAQGSTIIHLHYDDIKYFKIVVCDKKKQTEISKTMNLILEKIGLEQKILSRYQEQKKFFLNNLFI